MTDPMLVAANKLAVDAFEVLRQSVDGLSAEALNWKPGGEDTNSMAAQTMHAMHATRLLLHVAVDLPHPKRDRPAEFSTAVSGPEELLDLIDTLGADCLSAINNAGEVDWGADRRWTRADGSTAEMTAGYALMHAIDHLRGHADEASLTRHVWKTHGQR